MFTLCLSSKKVSFIFFVSILLVIFLAYKLELTSYASFHYAKYLESRLSIMTDEDLDHGKSINIACIVCGNVEQAMMFKKLLFSAILLSESRLSFHLVVESESMRGIKNIYKLLPKKIQDRVKIFYYDPWFPEKDNNWWHYMYKPCVSEKIFFPRLIKNVSSLIYLDLDSLILTKLEKIWSKFLEFNQKEIMGASNDCPFSGCAYYSKVLGNPTHVPAVWKSGLNGGVIFMRLDRMREFDFENKIIQIAAIYGRKLQFAEQDLLNILFSGNIDRLKYFDCSYNYFPLFYCPHDNICNTTDGIKIVHGANHQLEKPGTLFQKITSLIENINFTRTSTENLNYISSELKTFKSYEGCENVKKSVFLL